MSQGTSLFKAGTLALLAFAGLTGCGGVQSATSAGSYAAHGVSFDYPPGWSQGPTGASAGCCRGQRLWSVAVSPNTVSSVDVRANRLSVVVTRLNLRVLLPSVVRQVRGSIRQGHGELLAGPQAITVGGMPGLRFGGTAKIHGTAFKVTLVAAFNGRTDYLIACASTPAQARAVRRGCAQVLRTFKVRKLFTAGAALVYRAHGVSFDYPPAWVEGTPGSSAGCRRCQSWAASVGLDAFNAVDVTPGRQGIRVTRKNLPEITPYATRTQRRQFRQAGGRLLAGPHAITVGEMPGLLYQGTANLHGTALQVTAAVVFNGTTNYTIACSSTPAKARAVQRACAQVLRTFKVTSRAVRA